MRDDPGRPVDGPGALGERRAPVVVTVLAAMALPFLMPVEVSTDRRWIAASVLGILLVAMLVMDPGRIDRRSRGVRAVRLALITALTAGAAYATVRLVTVILRGEDGADSASDLLRAGGLVWLYLVIAFAFVYWELDGGGPGERAHTTPEFPDLMFPQHGNPELAPPGWRPVFVDYLYLALTGAIAFSPTDTLPLAHWAKAAMAVEALASLTIIGLVVARAVNILA
ncbi:MAG: hypothetical protein KDB35_08340 [Acidimicrobiales bacterium]|nr:hypothetical protein [Acidimicrobiales bacterium]